MLGWGADRTTVQSTTTPLARSTKPVITSPFARWTVTAKVRYPPRDSRRVDTRATPSPCFITTERAWSAEMLASSVDAVGDGRGLRVRSGADRGSWSDDAAASAGVGSAAASTRGTFGRSEDSIGGRATASADGGVAAWSAVVWATAGVGCSSATSWTLDASGSVVLAALITATLATEPAMRTPPAATTVAMMLERCMVFSCRSGRGRR